LEEALKAELSSERFVIKSLSPEIDELKVYLSWMRNKNANPFIHGINEAFSSQELVEYISEKNDSSSALLLGIFVKPEDTHIGNVKLEPIIPRKSAAIGILIATRVSEPLGTWFRKLNSKNLFKSYSTNLLRLTSFIASWAPLSCFNMLKRVEKLMAPRTF
jgi:hypothetical protein